MVFQRENSEVMKLIQEYETLMANQPYVEKPKEDLHYSDLLPDLEFIESQLWNAQLNVEKLKVYNDEDRPADLHIISEVKQERFSRQRKLQVNTAKRVLRRFWVDKSGRLEKECQTDTDEIAVFKTFYEDQIDALMETSLENDKIGVRQEHKIQAQLNMLELRDRKITDCQLVIESKNTSIDELNISKEVLQRDAKEKDREISKIISEIESLKVSLQNKENLAMRYIKQIQELKDSNKKFEKDYANLENSNNLTQLENDKNSLNNGNTTNRLQNTQSELE